MSQENLNALLKIDATQIQLMVIQTLNKRLSYYKNDINEISLITAYLSTLCRIYGKSVQGNALKNTVMFMTKFNDKYKDAAKLSAIGDNTQIKNLRHEFKNVFGNLMTVFNAELISWEFEEKLEITKNDKKH